MAFCLLLLLLFFCLKRSYIYLPLAKLLHLVLSPSSLICNVGIIRVHSSEILRLVLIGIHIKYLAQHLILKTFIHKIALILLFYSLPCAGTNSLNFMSFFFHCPNHKTTFPWLYKKHVMNHDI